MKPKNIAYLKSLANTLTPAVNIGKGEVDDNIIKAISNNLEAHELIKVKVLNNAEVDKKEIGGYLASKVEATHVATIGHIVILYRQKKKDPKIVLPIKE